MRGKKDRSEGLLGGNKKRKTRKGKELRHLRGKKERSKGLLGGNKKKKSRKGKE